MSLRQMSPSKHRLNRQQTSSFRDLVVLVRLWKSLQSVCFRQGVMQSLALVQMDMFSFEMQHLLEHS